MIFKEFTSRSQFVSIFDEAGHRAEQQMAFYLRRYFDNSREFVVFNDAKILHRGELAQVDHLILHAGGLVLVESKSVSSEIRISPELQWSRVYKGGEQGIRSPLLQCEMQAMILRANFREYADPDWAGIRIDTLVAVSDGGVIRYPFGNALPHVTKADQIPALIKSIADASPPVFVDGVGRVRMALYLYGAVNAADELLSLREDPLTAYEPKGDKQFTHDIAIGGLEGAPKEEIYRFLERVQYRDAAYELTKSPDLLRDFKELLAPC